MIAAHRQQRPIPSDDEVCLGRERGADHHIVIGIGRDARRGRRPHEGGEFRVSIHQWIDAQQRSGDLLVELAPPENIGQLGPLADQLAFFARRSVRIVATSAATSPGAIAAGSSATAMRSNV